MYYVQTHEHFGDALEHFEHFGDALDKLDKRRVYSKTDIEEDEKLVDIATRVNQHGIKKMDSLHMACAITAGADYFLTTDDEILKRAIHIQGIRITDPIGFIKEVLS